MSSDLYFLALVVYSIFNRSSDTVFINVVFNLGLIWRTVSDYSAKYGKIERVNTEVINIICPRSFLGSVSVINV